MSRNSRTDFFFTFSQGALELLADRQELYPGPEVRACALGNPERPAPAADVPPVLPDGLEAFLEQVDRLAHLDLVDGCVVVVSPEVLHRLDLAAELLELSLVLVVVSLLLVLLLSVRGGPVLAVTTILRAHSLGEIYALIIWDLPIKVDIPVVLGWQRAHGLQEVPLCIVSLLSG